MRKKSDTFAYSSVVPNSVDPNDPGGTSRVDASGRSIYNPKTADRNYGSVNYSQFGGFYFVKYQ